MLEPSDSFENGFVGQGVMDAMLPLSFPSGSHPLCPIVNDGDLAGVWFRVVSRTGNCITFTTAGSDFDTRLAVFESDCASLKCVASNDDYSATESSMTSIVTVNPDAPGRVYNVLVSGQQSRVGRFLFTAKVRFCVLFAHHNHATY